MNSRLDTGLRVGFRLWYWGWRTQKEWQNLRRKVKAWWYS